MNENIADSSRKKSNSRTGSPDIRQFLTPLSVHIAYDLKLESSKFEMNNFKSKKKYC